MSIISYVMASSLSVFVAIIATIWMIDYFNGKAFNSHGSYILKILKLVFVSGFFAISYSFVTLYFDKRKIKKLINQFKYECNEISCNEGTHLISNMDGKAVFDVLREIKKRNLRDGELRELDIQSISVIVTGIIKKKMEYRVHCISLYASERSENVYFNFYTINGGDIMLKNIEYSVDMGQAQA